jgi:seryl-tRNA synthetase
MRNRKIIINLKKELHSNLHAHFEDRLKYLNNSILAINFIDSKMLEISCDHGADEVDISNTVREAVDVALDANIDFIDEKIIFDNTSANYVPKDFTHELIEKGYVQSSQDGFYSFFGPVKKLLDTIDRWFFEMAKELRCQDITLPSIISSEDLMTAGHFNTFPHHVYLVNNLDLTSKQEVHTNKICSTDLNDRSVHSGVCLTPSVCYNYFRLLKDKSITTIDQSMITARCNCYRYELSDVAPFRRQKEFDMREVVFIGVPGDVENIRMKLIERTWDIVMNYDIKAKVVNASDPFFLDDISARTAVQYNREMKFELQTFYSKHKSIATSSYNLHSSSFVNAFNINQDKKVSVSGCVGWGLERWVLILFSRFSTNPVNWPSELQHIFQYEGC